MTLPEYVDEEPHCQYNFKWTSPAGCETAPLPPEAPGACVLAGQRWNTTYSTNDTRILVHDYLSIDATGGFLNQFYCQPEVLDNVLNNYGTIEQVDQKSAVMTYKSCTSTGPTCVKCVDPGVDYVALNFDADCNGFAFRSVGGLRDPRYYRKLD